MKYGRQPLLAFAPAWQDAPCCHVAMLLAARPPVRSHLSLPRVRHRL
jgi:hypothetical protein